MSVEISNAPIYASIGNRYTSAWSEINTRIQARQTVQLYFVTATISIITLALNNRENEILSTTISIGLVALSCIFILWIKHHEACIGLLGVYCREIEKMDDNDNKNGFPAWHTEDQQMIVNARLYRQLSDIAIIALILASGLLTFYLSYTYYDRSSSSNLSSLLLSLSGLISLCISWITYKNKNLRQKIACMRFKQCHDGKWRFLPPENPPEMSHRA